MRARGILACAMARREADILKRLGSLEEEVRALRRAMPAAVRFQVLMRRMRERTRGVPARAIARAAVQAVHEVRREARRRTAS